MVYTLTCNPAIDYVVQLDAPLTGGAINRSCREIYQFGGKGINVSNVLRELGQPTVAMGFVAGFTGRALEESLHEMGLVTDFIHLPEGHTRINVKVKSDMETEINGAGPQIDETAILALDERLDELQPGDTLVLSGSVPKCLGTDAYGRILSRLQGKKIRTVVDAGGALLTNALPHKPFLVKPNREELEAIVGHPLSGDEQIVDAAQQLQDMGAVNVLVSLAGDGALLLDEMGCIHCPPCPQGQIRNSVGAGDSMVAGFLAGYLQTGNYAYALRLGIAAGSATAFSLELATKEEIHALLEKM